MTLQIGDKAPAFKLTNVDGSTVSLDNLERCNAVAVVFSCNHCPYVLAWEDRLIAIQKDYAHRGVQLVLINSNDAVKYPADSFEAMKSHAAAKGYPFPYLHDSTQQVAHAYGAERTPHVFLFDGEGKLAYAGAIDDNYEEPAAVKHPYLRDALDAVLSGSAPEVALTPSVGCTIKWK